MEEFIGGVVVGWFLSGLAKGRTSSFGDSFSGRLNGWLMRKRYERFLAKAKNGGFELEFHEEWKMYEGHSFAYQTAEAYHAFRRAKKRFISFKDLWFALPPEKRTPEARRALQPPSWYA